MLLCICVCIHVRVCTLYACVCVYVCATALVLKKSENNSLDYMRLKNSDFGAWLQTPLPAEPSCRPQKIKMFVFDVLQSHL